MGKEEGFSLLRPMFCYLEGGWLVLLSGEGYGLVSAGAKTLDETIISIFTLKTQSQGSDSFTSKGVLMTSQN